MLRRPLVAVSLALLAWWIVCLAVSVPAGWHAEVGTDDLNAADWVGKGTLVAPPLVPLLVQATLTALAWFDQRRARLAAGTGLAVLGVVFLAAGFAEPWEPQRSDPPLAALIALRVPAIVGSAALVLVGGRAAVAAWRARLP